MESVRGMALMICDKAAYEPTDLAGRAGIQLLAEFDKLRALLSIDSNEQLTVFLLDLGFFHVCLVQRQLLPEEALTFLSHGDQA